MDVFVYGTLTDADRVADLLDEFSFRGDATLRGLRRVEGAYPTLVPGGSVDGRILRTPEIDRLDAYEGVDRGLYVRVPVPVEGGEGRGGEGQRFDGIGDGGGRGNGNGIGDGDSAAVYVGDADALDVVEPVRWPDDGSLADRIAVFVAENGVIIRTEP